MKPLSKNIIIFIVSLIAIGAVFSTVNVKSDKPSEVNMNAIVEQIHAGTVDHIDVEEDTVNVTLNDGGKLKSKKESGQPLSELLSALGVTTEELTKLQVNVKDLSGKDYFLRSILPSILPLFILIVIFWFMIRQLQGSNSKAMSFGQSSAREVDQSKNKITFKEVAGVKEAKEELMEIVEFLRDPKKFVDLGAKIPKGVLLMGSPGTGKTLLARAVAGEADVPFFHISGSEFVEMFVGVGASRVRDLFAKAKKSTPCIIFIDEIDAVGRQRGAGLGGGHDEREQTLNQILVEMDGFDPNLGVIVIAATNRPDVLDPALLRPGRFDRRVVIDLPDIKDREAILAIHANNKPLEPEVSLRQVAERTVGFSGADLGNLLNEAAILAARRDKKTIGPAEVLESVDKVILGPERKSHMLSTKEREVTAYHEAGHALVAHELPHADPVHKISIISRGRAAGYTMKLPVEDKKLHMRAEFIDEMAVLLGGFTSEKTIFGDVTTGASDDLQRATKIAKELITKYGMSATLGPRTFGKNEEMIFLGREIRENRDYSEKLAEAIDGEIATMINTAMATAQEIIVRKRDKLDAIVKALIAKETLEREQFEAIFKN
ncbi:MAG: ATP-dependent zinc metalloprotease FtsH [Patescibacteria group bacterium]